jgi:hypothetical protein
MNQPKDWIYSPFPTSFCIYTGKYRTMESQKEYQSFSYFRCTLMTMKPVLIIGLLFISLLSLPAIALEQQVAVPYTLADRDRAILTEARLGTVDARISSLEARMEIKFDSQQRQLDDLKTLFYWGFGIIITLFLFMLGYMIWDRRTAMKPALIQASKAMENSSNFLTVLRDYSKKHPDLAEIMRTHGLL